MKNSALFTFLFFTFAVFSSITAQAKPDSSLRDDGIRMRSADLERTKRDAEKTNSAPQMNSEINSKFPEIKEDYEKIQLGQAAIVKAYTTGEKINYEQIEKSAKDMIKNAERLNSNLFTSASETDKDKSDKKSGEKTKGVKDLIVDLDNAIGSFVSSAMFQDLRTVDPKVADKAQNDLTHILKISRALSKEAGKMK